MRKLLGFAFTGFGIALAVGCSAAPQDEGRAAAEQDLSRNETSCIEGPIGGYVKWMVDEGCGCRALPPNATPAMKEMCFYQSGLAKCLGTTKCSPATLPILHRVLKNDRRTWASFELQSREDMHQVLACEQVYKIHACIESLNRVNGPSGKPFAYPQVEGHFAPTCERNLLNACNFSFSTDAVHDPCPGSCVGYD